MRGISSRLRKQISSCRCLGHPKVPMHFFSCALLLAFEEGLLLKFEVWGQPVADSLSVNLGDTSPLVLSLSSLLLSWSSGSNERNKL